MKLISTLGIVFAFLVLCPMLFAQEPTQDPDRQIRIEKALKELKDKDARVRRSAVWDLVNLGGKKYVKNIAGLLKDRDAVVRGDAAEALGKLGAKEYVKDIAGLLKDKEAIVRGDAAEALGELGAKEYAKERLARKIVSKRFM